MSSAVSDTPNATTSSPSGSASLAPFHHDLDSVSSSPYELPVGFAVEAPLARAPAAFSLASLDTLYAHVPGQFQDLSDPAELSYLHTGHTHFDAQFSIFTPVSESEAFHQGLHPPVDISPVSSHATHLSPLPTNITSSPPSDHHHPPPPSSRGSPGVCDQPPPTFPSQWSPQPQPISPRPSGEGLGIEPSLQLTPAPSPPPTRRRAANSVSSSTMPEIAPLRSQRQYAPIAPHPQGLRQLQQNHTKRSISEDDCETPPAKKQKKRSSTPSPQVVELTDEDHFLLRLKEEEGLSWKDISARFQQETNRTYQIPALQMRLKRLKERMRQWTEVDVQALKAAHDYYISNKFEIIANKMQEFGAHEKWNPRQCARKWSDLTCTPELPGGIVGHLQPTPPSFVPSYTSSPVEGNNGIFPWPLVTNA